MTLAMASFDAAAADDAERGRAIAESRTGAVRACHALPGVPAVQAGTIGPNLADVCARLSVDDLHARLVTPERFNPETVMPSQARSDGFARVANARRRQALLDAQWIDDVVACLATLK